MTLVRRHPGSRAAIAARLLLAAVVGAILLAWPGRAAAAPTITEFTAGLTANSGPAGIAAGPDGNLWFTEHNNPARIGRITPAGVITQFTGGLTANGNPVGIAAGPDGNLWFTEKASPGRIGRITPAGVVTEFTGLTANSAPFGIVAGPDGSLWFTESSQRRIGRITPAGVITEFTGLTGNPAGIAAGPDGNLWFTESQGRIGRITPAGTITEFTAPVMTAPAAPNNIAAGPDGNLWFAVADSPGRIGRITPAGVITQFAAGLTGNPAGIAAGPDGNLWFTESGNPGRIGRITPAGKITEFTAGLTPNGAPLGIAAGTGGNLWFTEAAGPGRIGRITAGPGVATGGASNVSARAATLHGSVRPSGQPTAFKFQYGIDARYGSQTVAQFVGQDLAQHPVSATLSGLSPGTTYHYRLVAINQSDTAPGADRTFTTPVIPPVTPPATPPGKASFAGSKSSLRVDRKRRVRFTFHATAGLNGTATFKTVNAVRTTRRKVTLARTSFSVPPSGTVTLRITLSKHSFRIVKLNHKLRIRVIVQLRNAAGLTSTATKKVTVTAPRNPGSAVA